MKKIGLNLYSLRDYVQTEDEMKSTLEKVQEAGYTGVQISGVKSLEAETIAQIVSGFDLKIAATHLGWDMFLQQLDRVIEIHKLYDCPHTAIGGLPNDYRSSEGLKRFVDEAGPVVEALQKEGMDFSYHNHHHELSRIEGGTWLGRCIEETKAIGVNFEIDTYWIQAGGGNPVSWIEKCSGRIPLLHAKDMEITFDRNQQFAPVGWGNLEWDAILSQAEKSGVEWYLVEQDAFFGADPFDSVAKSCEFLNKQL
jgi:sugar phosphate isomerase/epimerase